jgi:hypothetical protein
MENEAPRTASQVILELEAKVDNLTDLVKSQNFANQLLSNNITELIQLVKTMNVSSSQTSRTPSAEAVDFIPQIQSFQQQRHNLEQQDPDRYMPIFAENKILDVKDMLVPRRTSRPDGDKVVNSPSPPPKQDEEMEFRPYAPKAPTVAKQVSQQKIQQPVIQQTQQPVQQPVQQNNKFVVQNAVPIIQRVVDGNGKSQFLAEVEIVNADTSKLALKTKTNASGKWVASLSPGNYQVVIRKKGNGGNIKDLQAVQTIPIDGSVSPLEIKTITVKPA